MGDFATSTQTAKTKQNENSTANTSPWAPQTGYLKDIFGKAETMYDSLDQNGYSGDQLAAFRPEQLDMFNKEIQYANSSPIAGMLQGQGQDFSNIGKGATAGGLQGLTNFTPTGTTMGTIADAGLYADNPFISSMVDGAMRDAQRVTYEGELPQNARNAALSGNVNSNKYAISDAVAQRGLADRTADVSAALRGDAYSKGLDLSQNQSQFNDTAKLDSLRSILSGGLSAAGIGSDSLTGSLNAQATLFGLGDYGASGLQAGDQQALNNEIAKYQFGQQDPWTLLNNYYNLVGDKSWGGNVVSNGSSTGATNTSSTASPAAVAGGLLTSLGSVIPGKK